MMNQTQNQNQTSREASPGSTPDGSIGVLLNGEGCRVAPAGTVATLLEAQGIDPERPGIAVAVNDQLVRRSDWRRRIIEEGDRIEVITALQGG